MTFKLPASLLDQHLVLLGKTGSGKSSKLRVLVEGLMQKKKRVCVIDPKGDWWGVKLGADGKSPGLPMILFGDFKNDGARDVPINDRSGQHIAELVADGNRPCVIGLRGWSQGAMTRFWIDFASTLFGRMGGELYLVGDEFHNFAPKQWKQMSDNQTPVGQGLHWANRLLSEGRGLGLVCLIASQRPQKVHNDTLTSCETLMAARVIHAADRAAIKAWIDGNGDAELGKKVLDSLASMPREQAWVWSPEIGFGPELVTFPMFRTFDSFAPPQLQGKVSSKSWADVDLTAVQQKLAAVIEESKANDPKELKRQIAELRAQLSKKAPAAADSAAVDRARLTGEREGVRQSAAEVTKLRKQIQQFGDSFLAIKQRCDRHLAALTAEPIVEPVAPIINQERPIVNRKAPVINPKPPIIHAADVPFGKAERAILAAFLWLKGTHTDAARVAFYSGYRQSGSFTAAIGNLRKLGCVNGWAITDAGEAAIVADVGPRPSGAELREWLRPKLTEASNRILDALIAVHPQRLDNDSIAEATGYKQSGSFTAALGDLRKCDAIEGGKRDGNKASDVFFE